MAQTKKQQIVTTGRGGPVRLVLGCLLIAVGCGWLLALLAQNAPAYATLTLLRDTAHGLGGALCVGLPVFALWGGALLCVSSGHKVSVRTYGFALAMYWLLLSVATLVSRIGEQPLMNYVINSNKTWLGIGENTSFGACLTGAYHLRAFNHGELAGGGLLGMVWAWLLQASSFGVVGGSFILCAVELFLLLILFRFNPFELWGKARENSRQRQADMPAPGAGALGDQPAVPAGYRRGYLLVQWRMVLYRRAGSRAGDACPVRQAVRIPRRTGKDGALCADMRRAALRAGHG